MRRPRALALFVVLIAVSGCKDEKSESAASTEGAPEESFDAGEGESEGPDTSEPREVTVKLERGDHEIPVTMTVPAGWRAKERRANAFRPDTEERFTRAYMSLSAKCSGSCAAEDIPENIQETIANEKKTAIRPNFNTGDEELDAVRGELEVLEEKEIEGGKMLAYRVTFSDEVLDSGPYKETVEVSCYFHREGDDYYVLYSSRAELKDEESYLDDLLGACKSVEIGDAS